MASVRESEYAAIDFESAGVRPGGVELPVQVGVALMRGWEVCWDEGFVSLLACSGRVSARARDVHGIGNGRLHGAPVLLDLWPALRGLLAGRYVVAHGAATERRFLRAFPFHGFGPWVDTLKLARAFDPSQPSHALADLAAAYGIDEELRTRIPGFRWHDALCDAAAALLVLKHLVEVTALGSLPAEDLLAADDSLYHKAKHRPR